MAVKLQIPPPGTQFLDMNGDVSRPWRDLLAALIDRAGGIVGALQPQDGTLDALSGLDAVTGLVTETAPDTFTKRSIAVTPGELTVNNPTGAAGNPTLGLANVAGVAGIHASPASITVDGKGRITAIT